MFDKIAKGIYWDKAWSLVDGCTPVSAGCDNCWLRGMQRRFAGEAASEYAPEIFAPRFRPERLEIPLRRHKPTVYAIWSDLFLPCVTDENLLDVATRIIVSPQHQFLLLTKRPEHWESVNLFVEQNLWLGTTCENQEMADLRIPHVLKYPGKKFLSLEPLLGPIDLSRTEIPNSQRDGFGNATCHPLRVENGQYSFGYCGHIDWVIVGCESGAKHRHADIEWVRDIVRQCKTADVRVFVKQLEINGKVEHDMSLFPEDLRVREIPDLKG